MGNASNRAGAFVLRIVRVDTVILHRVLKSQEESKGQCPQNWLINRRIFKCRNPSTYREVHRWLPAILAGKPSGFARLYPVP